MKDRIDYKKEFIKRFNTLCYNNKSNYEVWDDTVTMFAISISNSCLNLLKVEEPYKTIWEEREEKYLSIIKKYDKKSQSLFTEMFSMLVNEYNNNPFQDLIGEIYMSIGINSKNKGQFFTPYSICKSMSNISISSDKLIHQIKNEGYIKVCDLSCGAGATLIGVAERVCELFKWKGLSWQNHICFVAQDIDRIAAMMCYIQLSLIGCPGYVIIGNTLHEPVVKDLKRIYFTPIWMSDVWTMRRFFYGTDILLCNSSKQKSKSDTEKIIDMRKMLEDKIKQIRGGK